MKVLFVHDGPLGIYNKSTYGIHYTNKLVERYTYFGNIITFLMRKIDLDISDLSNYSQLNHPNFKFTSIPDFKSLSKLHNKLEAKKIITSGIADNDIIICRLPSAAGVIAFKEAKKQDKPVLVENVACVFDALWNYDWRGKLLAHYKYYKYKAIFKEASHVLYVTEEFLQKRYPTNGKSIGCSDVVLSQHDEKNLSNRLNHINTPEAEVLKLSTVAAVDVVYKGQADVIKAIHILKDKGVFFKYDIIGQGDPTRLQKIIDEYNLNDLVKIVGPLPHEKVFEALENTDIYIQPSKQEGLPRAVIEAMSMACPIIGSDTGGIPELIENECVYEKGNITQLCAILSKIDVVFLSKHAKINFENSKRYNKTFLENKRTGFYNEFMNDYKL